MYRFIAFDMAGGKASSLVAAMKSTGTSIVVRSRLNPHQISPSSVLEGPAVLT